MASAGIFGKLRKDAKMPRGEFALDMLNPKPKLVANMFSVQIFAASFGYRISNPEFSLIKYLKYSLRLYFRLRKDVRTAGAACRQIFGLFAHN